MKKFDFKALKWIHNHSKNIYLPILFLTLLGVAISYISVLFALKSKDVLDAAQHMETGGGFKTKIIILLVLVGVEIFTQAVYTVLNTKITAKYSMGLKRSVFSEILKKDYLSVTKYHTGELLNRINSDVSVIVTSVINIVPNVVSLIARIVFSFITLFMLDSFFAFICLIVGPFILILTRIYSKKMKTLHKKCMETDGKTRSFMLECIQNILVIKTYKNENSVTDKSKEYQNENYKYSMKRSYISILMNVLFYLGVTAAYYVALAYCAYKVATGIMTFGTLTAILQLVGQVQMPFRQLASSIPQYFSAIASAERIMEISDLKDDVRSNIKLIDTNNLVCFKDVTFAYDKDPVIKNADFSMAKGEFVAIYGLSGIGKSTFLKLILGIIEPNEGKVSVYTKDFAYVPQGNLILSGSIKENIAFYSDIDDEKIIEASKIADIYDFISELPQGFDTNLGEKGLGLSEGQIQRIAIARAVYSGADFLILDECTSALDEKTEKNVLTNLKNTKGKSCIIVSHKKAALEICERTVEIENGKITDNNTIDN